MSGTSVTVSATAPTLAAALAQLGLTSGGSGGGTTPTIDYFPANPGAAPFPSPENSSISIVNGKPVSTFTVDGGGQPYLRDSQGVIWQFSLDANGNAIVYTPAGYASGYLITFNGTNNSDGAAQMIIRQGQLYYQGNWGGTGLFWYCTMLKYTSQTLPPPFAPSGGGTVVTPPLPPMPAMPTPSAVAPGALG